MSKTIDGFWEQAGVYDSSQKVPSPVLKDPYEYDADAELQSTGKTYLGREKTETNPRGGGQPNELKYVQSQGIAQGVSASRNSKYLAQRKLEDILANGEVRNKPTKGMYSGESEPQDYIDIYEHTLANPRRGGPWKYPTAEALQDEVTEYFMFMITRRIPVSVAMLCAWLGISVSTLKNWQREQDTKPFYPVVEQAIALIHGMLETGAEEGNINSSVFSFLSTNYFGLRLINQLKVEQTDHLSEFDDEEEKAILDRIPSV